MCGIAGIFSLQGQHVDPALLLRMTDSIRHRGPDDEGFLLVDVNKNVVEHRRGKDTIAELRIPYLLDPFEHGTATLAMGWRRLGIIDLSITGHQPMSNADRTLWVMFNGEIYNYIELRDELRHKGYVFRTQSDTEVILHAYAEWGTECLHRFNGMWGLALWDQARQRLFCARDRFGVKPFYYCADSQSFAFASEIKALLEMPTVRREANDDAVYDFLVHRTLDHTEQTLFSGIVQLPPGHFALVDPSGMRIRQYYSPQYNPEIGNFNDALAERYAEEFREHFTSAVRLRLRSDVALGSCLSGGLDSSSIVCVANDLIFQQGLANRATIGDRQKTFTATYDLAQYSEDAFVSTVIDRTNAAPHFVKPSAQRLWEELPQFIRSNDEPFISTSMYAQRCVMRLAAEHGMKVLLDGQGADELLGGYRRWHFPIFHAELLRNGRFVEFSREITQGAAIADESRVDWIARAAQKLFRRAIPSRHYHRFVAPSELMRPDFLRRSTSRVNKDDTAFQRRLWEDETRYNLQQLLHYEDRNSMAFSIEARVPFVDYRLVEFVMSLPAVYKIHGGWSKYVLRRSMQGILPESIQWRRDKMGFVTPETEWLAELRPLFVQRLNEEPFRTARFVNDKLLLAQLSNPNTKLKSYDLWRFVNLELWMREFNVL